MSAHTSPHAAFPRSQFVSTPNAAGADASIGVSKVVRKSIFVPVVVVALLAVPARRGMAWSGGVESDGTRPTYNNGYDGRRFSPAAQITAANVNTLKRVCKSNLGDSWAFHSGSIVQTDPLDVTTGLRSGRFNSSSC